MLLTASLVGSYLYLGEAGVVSDPQVTYLDLPVCLACVAICAIPPRADEPGSKSVSRTRSVLVGAGDGSYSTYLTHGFLVGPAGRVLDATSITMPAALFATGSVLVCTLSGWMVFRRVEKPLQDWMNTRWGQRGAVNVPC
jgi:peptidoglycan/LPS O-acetylase OafA/YrhL